VITETAQKEKKKDWIKINPRKTIFITFDFKGNKNSLSLINDTKDTLGIDTVDMIEVSSCNSAEQDLAIADCRRSQSGQPIT